MGIRNALAFNVEGLMTLTALNTVNLLTNVTKSVVIHGFDFTEALEHALKQSHTLGKHTGIVHLTPYHVMQYVWAHKDYQHWGAKIALQCPQCGIVNPWTKVYMVEQTYGVECKNVDCGRMGGGPVREPYSF